MLNGSPGGYPCHLTSCRGFHGLVRCRRCSDAEGRPAQSSGTEPAAAEPTLPYTPSLDVTAMDRTVDPCVDFYQYSCGGWQKNNPIPPDQTSWSVYGKLYFDNLGYLKELLQEAAVEKDRDPVTQKIGDFYASCMNETLVEKLGAKPMQPDLAAVSWTQEHEGVGSADCGAADAGNVGAVRLRADAGPGRLQQDDRRARPGGAGPSGPRLLHQGRCEVEGDARALRAACAEDV